MMETISKLTIKEIQMIQLGFDFIAFLIILFFLVRIAGLLGRLFWESDLTTYLRENNFTGRGNRKTDRGKK